MSNQAFQKRTFDFGIRCVRLVEALPKSMSAQTIGKQLIRAARSVGANYRAAVRGRSRGDFLSRMGIVSGKRVEELRKEANEIIAITVSSIKTARKNAKN